MNMHPDFRRLLITLQAVDMHNYRIFSGQGFLLDSQQNGIAHARINSQLFPRPSPALKLHAHGGCDRTQTFFWSLKHSCLSSANGYSPDPPGPHRHARGSQKHSPDWAFNPMGIWRKSMRDFRFHRVTVVLLAVLALMAATHFIQQTAYSQSTTAAGAIQGTITDPSGAILPGSQVTVTEVGTGAKKTLITDSSGFYSVASLVPGQYQVSATSAGFATTTTTLTVQIGNTANGNLKLKLGAATEQVIVNSAALQVNTVQSTVQGVLTEEQIDNLPISGRNFLARSPTRNSCVRAGARPS